MHNEVTVLLPCLNEKRTIRTCIDKAFKFFEDYDVDGEVLVADNGSSDGSIAIVEESPARLVNVSQRGYGAAIRGGIENASGKYIIMCDCDDSYDMDNMMPFLEKLRDAGVTGCIWAALKRVQPAFHTTGE